MVNEINQAAKAIYGQYKEVYEQWAKGTDPFRKSLAKTIIKAAGAES